MKKIFIPVLFFLIFFINAATAQTVAPQVINTSGGTYSFGYIIIDWSVGEMAMVNTLQGANLQVLVTHGFLQPFTDRPADMNVNYVFGPEEIRVFPNPASTFVEIDFLTKQKGRVRFKLYDGLGQMLYQKEFYSYGLGQIERIDMQKWASSEYYLHVVLEPEAGSVRKHGSYKIIKIK